MSRLSTAVVVLLAAVSPSWYMTAFLLVAMAIFFGFRHPRVAMPGVLAVYTGTDLTEYGTLKCIVPFNNRDGSPMKTPSVGQATLFQYASISVSPFR